ncbi:unnamed protein product [Camellia sinensis]
MLMGLDPLWGLYCLFLGFCCLRELYFPWYVSRIIPLFVGQARERPRPGRDETPLSGPCVGRRCVAREGSLDL